MATELKLKFKIKKRLSERFTLEAEIQLDLLQSPITAVFGPSGSGKTSLLRCLAGLESPEYGEITFQNEIWFDGAQGISVPPQLRRIGYLSQESKLFPHLNVKQNIGYGLRQLPDKEAKVRVSSLFSLLKLEGLENHSPSQLSGGETQRVALARTLAPQPRLLLLDEPLSALDTPSRESLRLELRRLLKHLHLPALLVTHDRTETCTLADEMLLMEQGRIEQKGRVDEVFRYPRSISAAKALGVENLFRAVRSKETKNAEKRGGENQLVCIRAEDITLTRNQEAVPTDLTPMVGIIQDIVQEGALVRIRIDCCEVLLYALITRASFESYSFKNLEKVYAFVKPERTHLIQDRNSVEGGGP
ncbi:MAG: ABC transporter ATP-binding protein [Bdellovibrionia bacterium]